MNARLSVCLSVCRYIKLIKVVKRPSREAGTRTHKRGEKEKRKRHAELEALDGKEAQTDLARQKPLFK